MKNLQPMEEIMSSWRRCMEVGMLNKALTPNFYLNGEELQEALRRNTLLTSTFECLFDKIDELIEESNHLFLLVDDQGFLLKKKAVEA